mgnify:CR=1 FL=1
MPLAGGPSDKAGNSYERRWTVFALIDLLLGRAQTIRIEVPGEDGAGSEFRLMVGGVPEWHQVKRQRSAGSWTVSALASERVLQPWQAKLTRGERCVFVSSTSADELRELAERARSAQSWDEFNAKFLTADPVRKSFDRLCRAWNNPPEAAVWNGLRHVQVHGIDENDLAQWINDRLRAYTAGADPGTVAAVLAQLVDDSVHQELSAADVWAYLAKHGIVRRDLDRDAAVVRRVADSAESYLARLRPLYIGGHELPRQEARTALNHLDEGRRVILVGGAGVGKSVVTAQVVTLARERRWPVLVISADRLPDTATTTQLGAELGLSDSPSTVLAGVAAGGVALLVIDQLDAVGVVSGRHPERLRLITDLLREARSYPRLRVLLACRQFDIDNDRELRAVVRDDNAALVTVGDLDEGQIRQVLAAAGLPVKVPTPLMRLLAVPLHLALYVELEKDGVGDVQSARTLIDLYDSYWKAKRTACQRARDGADEWMPVIERLVRRMSDRQEHFVPEPLLDDLDQQVKVMASEGVLTVGQARVQFFHETFFDYCFARHYLASGATVRDLLITSEQDLFRRAQVRQILTYERGADFGRYIADFAWIITSPEVRLHIKALVVALLDNLSNPTAEEWQVLRPIAEDPLSPLHLRLWEALRRNPAWFPVLDAADTWATLLRSGGDPADRALWALTGCAADHAARVCELLTEAPDKFWIPRRRQFLRLVDVQRARELVDLLLTAINDGDFDVDNSDLAHTLGELATVRPTWAIEVLAAFVRRVRTAEMVKPTSSADPHSALSQDFAFDPRVIATQAPGEFVDRLLQEFLSLMCENERPDWARTELVPDALWHYRIYGSHASLSDNLFEGMGLALAALADADPAHAAEAFALLRAEPYEAAAFLLARGYAGNPATFADDAVDWLTTTSGARVLGYVDAPAWVSRQLVAAISPHCSPARFDQLVEALLYYAPPAERTYKGRRTRGITELCLLNGVDAARRPSRVERRLAELRRKFGLDDVAPPKGITGGVVPPPIPEDRARKMTDRQWLKAMRRYGSSGTTWRGERLIGDAWTQAQVLETLTKENPQRFARLLLAMPPGTSEAYLSAILRGLTGVRLDGDLLLKVCRHASDVGGSDANRWLVRLIEAHAAGSVDDELVGMVAKVAVIDPDPARRPPGEPWNGGSIDSAALNSARGAAALAIGKLVFEEPARLAIVKPALHQLVTDPQPEVRAAAVGALASLLDIDSDLALALFHDAVGQGNGELLGSRYVERFLRDAIRQGHYAAVRALLGHMLTDQHDPAREAAARLLAFASYHAPDVDSEVDAVLNGADDIARAAAVSVFANNITYVPRRDRSVAVVSAAFNDPVKAVRDAGGRAFYHLENERLTDYAAMIAAFARSRALADGAWAALHAVESSRQPLPPVILDLCEAFVRTHQDAIGNIATSAAADAIDVVRLTLRIHAQHTDPEVRRRCLDLIDQLVMLRAHGIERDLETIER